MNLLFQACYAPQRNCQIGTKETDVGGRVAKPRGAAESGVDPLYEARAW